MLYVTLAGRSSCNQDWNAINDWIDALASSADDLLAIRLED
jgi:hypothetical protein